MSACRVVARPLHFAARAKFDLYTITSRVRSRNSSSVTAVPIPPAPPTTTISFPSSPSANRRSLSALHSCILPRDVPATHDHEEHREHLAIPEVMLKYSADHGCDPDRDAA